MKLVSIPITQDILNAIAEIDEFKGSWRLLGKLSPDRLKQLQKTALIKKVTALMQADGYHVYETQVIEVLRSLNSEHFNSEESGVAAGLLFVLQEIAAHATHIACSHTGIKQLHRWLCRYNKSEKELAGQYKKRPNNVISDTQESAISCILMNTALPYQTEAMVDELLYAITDMRAQKQLHPLQIIAFFVARFLLIHPFDSANHMMMHLLLELLLLQHGYAYVAYSTLDVLHHNKEQLYGMLSRLYKGSELQEQPFIVWMRFLLYRLLDQKRSLQAVIEREQVLHLHVSDYASTVLNLIQEHGKLSLRELVQLTGFNKHTTKKHVQELVKKQQVVMHGKARATWYTVL